ncbi:MAG: hypothetical protein AAB581_00195 [Patescibacteria group bacterium]
MMGIIYLLQAAVFIYLSYLGGKFVCDRIGITGHATETRIFVYAVGTGYGVIGTAGLLFALAGLYRPIMFCALATVIAFLARDTLRRHIVFLRSVSFAQHVRNTGEYLRQGYARHTLIKVIITAWILLYCAISLLPSAVDYNDGLYYHIPFAMEIVQSSSLSFPVRNEAEYGHLPLFTETLYGVPMTLFHNFVSFKVIQLSAYLLLLLLLVDLAKKYIRDERFVWVMVVFLLANMPLVKNALDGGMVDIFTFFFGFTAVFVLAELVASRIKPDHTASAMFVSAIFLGLALATKYLALFFGVLCFVLIAWFCLKHRERIGDIAKRYAVYAVPVALLAGFWYVKNIWYTGNPVFPIFSAEDTGIGFQESVNRFVLERTVLNFFLFPFFLFGKELFFLPYPLMTAASFAALYVMTAVLFFKKRVLPIMLVFFVCMELYFLMLFFFSHQVRFAVPALILSAPLLALTLDALFTDFVQRTPTIHRLFSFGVGILAGILFAVSIGSATLSDNLQCLVGIKDSNRCLEEKVGPYLNAPDNSYLEFYRLP